MSITSPRGATIDIPTCVMHVGWLLKAGFATLDVVCLTIFRAGEHSEGRPCAWPFDDHTKELRETLTEWKRLWNMGELQPHYASEGPSDALLELTERLTL